MKNESEIMTPEKTAASDRGSKSKDAPSGDEKSHRFIINFHSPDFNHTDDLNDFSGGLCAYEPLGDVVTADMRHQMERRRRGDMIYPPTDGAVHIAVPVKQTEDEAAVGETAAPLTVVSEGRTLIVDTDAERAAACASVLRRRRLDCTVLITKGAFPGSSFTRPTPRDFLEVNAVAITGAFGGFSATVSANRTQKRLAELLGSETAVFDLVLDLQPSHSFADDILPMGYYAAGSNAAALNAALAELPEMRGRFKKPQFASFQEKRCLHGRSRTRDCRKCLDICPFGAIKSVSRKISINHYLCQGCGGCVLVCPSDAIRLLEPSREGMLEALKGSLNHSSEGVAVPTTLLISDGYKRTEIGERTGEKKICLPVHFKVEQIGHVGLDVILAAFVYGARRVEVACRSQYPPGIQKAVERETQIAGAILKGLGLPEDSIRFTVFDEDRDAEKAAPATAEIGIDNNPDFVPELFPPGGDLRTIIRLAAQHLYDRSGINEPGLSLPAGSPFGAVSVDTVTCTLCKACATVCPSGALSASTDVPRLTFRESRCYQCGFCEEACPEGAIRLLPRLLCDPGAIEALTVLHEAEPFHCVSCGAPFASPAMITRMENKLTGHWMYVGERQLRRLRMCRTCRTRDAMTTEG